MPINLTIHFDVKPERYDDFLAMLQDVKRDLPGTEGCLDIRIFERADVGHGLTLLESWASQAQHEEHVAELVQSGAWETLRASLTADPVSFYMREL